MEQCIQEWKGLHQQNIWNKNVATFCAGRISLYVLLDMYSRVYTNRLNQNLYLKIGDSVTVLGQRVVCSFLYHQCSSQAGGTGGHPAGELQKEETFCLVSQQQCDWMPLPALLAQVKEQKRRTTGVWPMFLKRIGKIEYVSLLGQGEYIFLCK